MNNFPYFETCASLFQVSPSPDLEGSKLKKRWGRLVENIWYLKFSVGPYNHFTSFQVNSYTHASRE